MGSSPGPASAGLTATHKINENPKNKKNLAPREGLEPPTKWLTATRSTDWATGEPAW